MKVTFRVYRSLVSFPSMSMNIFIARWEWSYSYVRWHSISFKAFALQKWTNYKNPPKLAWRTDGAQNAVTDSHARLIRSRLWKWRALMYGWPVVLIIKMRGGGPLERVSRPSTSEYKAMKTVEKIIIIRIKETDVEQYSSLSEQKNWKSSWKLILMK